MVWIEFYFLFIKFPPKFKRTGSAYILVSFFFILFICACFLLLLLYNSVIPSFTEPIFVSSKTISYKETHHFYQNKMLKIKKTNLKHRNVMFLIQPSLFLGDYIYNFIKMSSLYISHIQK